VSPRIERIQHAVEAMHNCRATHAKSVPVNETFEGAPVWQGVVEVFDIDHPMNIKRCYAWSFMERGVEQYVAVLEKPPVDSPVTAVRAAIVAQSKIPGA
jgi:hypothetical protein